MEKPIDEDVIAIQARIFAGRLKLGAVLKAAEVNRSTWSRWVHGAEPKAATLRKVSKAIDSLVAA